MADYEKVIKEFEWQIGHFSPADTSDERFKETCNAVLKLLKEQREDIEDLMQLLKFPDLWEKYKNQPKIVMCKDCLLRSGTDDEYMLIKCANGEWHDSYWFCADGKTNA